MTSQCRAAFTGSGDLDGYLAARRFSVWAELFLRKKGTDRGWFGQFDNQCAEGLRHMS